MLSNAYFLAKIGADTAENEQHFAEILPIGRRVADRVPCMLSASRVRFGEIVACTQPRYDARSLEELWPRFRHTVQPFRWLLLVETGEKCAQLKASRRASRRPV